MNPCTYRGRDLCRIFMLKSHLHLQIDFDTLIFKNANLLVIHELQKSFVLNGKACQTQGVLVPAEAKINSAR